MKYANPYVQNKINFLFQFYFEIDLLNARYSLAKSKFD